MSTTKNYGGLPKDYSGKNSPIVILPVPYDATSTWIKGADKGPGAIIEASANMELYDIDTDTSVCEKGIFTDAPVKESSSPESMVAAVKRRVENHLKNDKFVVVIGGEHSVSLGAIQAHKDLHNNISVLQFDAHSDLRQEYRGSIYNHACVMARAKELCPIVQVGIRSMDAEEIEFMDRNNVFFAKDIHDKRDWIQHVLPLLKDKVYITIDLDVFDPSVMPSTGTPEPGGLLWYDVLSLLKEVIEKKQVIGFDIVELCPNIHNKAPDFLAAKLIYAILSYRFR
ncbi:MAG: agmatinase [archaeon]